MCCIVTSACSQHSSSTPLLPAGMNAPALLREAASPNASFKSVYPFGKNAYDGSQPTFLVPFNGVLYGTTSNGGVHNEGIVFSVTPTGKEKILHTFALTDGGEPNGPLYNINGVFYGTTSSGGSPGNLGAVFAIDTDGNFTFLYAFKGGSTDGIQPYGGLVGLNGKLYGTTSGGGANGDGTVYSITLAGVEKVIHSFNGSDGFQPFSTLIVAHGDLYGTTMSGGKFGGGTIFRITTGGTLKTLHNFGKGNVGSKGPDGGIPYFGALLAVNDTLFGTTLHGGVKGVGTIFESSLTGTEKVLYSFGGTAAKGCEPWAGLVILNGVLYGTSVGGSTAPCLGNGTLFRVEGSSGATTLHKFSGGNGGNAPVGLAVMNNTLYGVTSGGGSFNQGLVYSYTP